MAFPAHYPLIDGRGGFAAIVVSGMLRVCAPYVADGRAVTYRNVAAGEVVGLGALLGIHDDIVVSTLTASTLFSLDVVATVHLLRRDASVALAVAREAVRRLQDTSREVELWVRGSVYERLVRYLLDAATGTTATDRAAVFVSHQVLADSIGSGREVVTRMLGALSRRGLVQLDRGKITICDLTALRHELG